MKIPKSTIHFLVALEALALVGILVLCVIHPWSVKPKNDVGGIATEHENIFDNIEENTENAIGEVVTPVISEPVFSDAVLAEVEKMTLEQKVAQMFITTPEELVGEDKVTVAGNATRNAIRDYPIGGLVYSAINFQGNAQTQNMLKGVQKFAEEEIGIPMFLMIEEAGGKKNSPYATVNKHKVQSSAAKIGESGDVQEAIDAAKAIAKYLKAAGFNMNLAPNADLTAGKDKAYDAKTYSKDADVAAMMVAESISTYGEEDILTVMSMFPGESSGNAMTEKILKWGQVNALVYKAGIDAGVDAIMVGNVYAEAFTGDTTTPCCMSEKVVRYLRANMQYDGLLISDSLSESNVSQEYSAAEAAVAAVQAGMDMLYCPDGLEKAYKGVLKAVEEGTIAEADIDKAVARILTCKEKLK